MPLLKRINGGFVEQPPCNLRRCASVLFCGRQERRQRGLRSRILFASLLLLAGFTQTGCAQELVQAPRADGAQTPLRVYSPSANGCAPLALISPGAGGSEDGYKYLAKGATRRRMAGHRDGTQRERHGGVAVGHAGLRRLAQGIAGTGERSCGLQCAADGHCRRAEVGRCFVQGAVRGAARSFHGRTYRRSGSGSEKQVSE